jgi:hypothetical protein
MDPDSKSKPLPYGVRCFLALKYAAYDSRLTRCDLAVLAVIINFFNEDDGIAWPAVETIAEQSNVSCRGVFRSIVKLERIGHLTIRRGGHRSNHYIPRLDNDTVVRDDRFVRGDRSDIPDMTVTKTLTTVSETPCQPCHPILLKNFPSELTQRRAQKRAPSVELQTWLDSLGDADAIPADDAIFAYAEKVGIPVDFLELSWGRFVEDMTERKTKKSNWRAHYRNFVRGNWYKIWWFAPSGDCQLTTTGYQARRAAA